MKYMQRPGALLADPACLLPSARSVAVFCIPYSHEPHPPLPHGHGRVARYAWGRDYHKVLRKRLALLVQLLSSECGFTPEHRIFSDSVPLLERELGRAAGLGFVGKNTMLIRPRVGSFFFLAEVLWDLEIQGSRLPLLEENCGTCRRCLDLCPTNAFPEPYVLDAGRCISYLTIEKRGPLSEWECEAVGEWIFGCDRCQDVCPFNHRALAAETSQALSEFDAEQGIGASIDLRMLLKTRTQIDFEKRFAGTALTRPKREGMLRNAAAVAANTACVDLWPELQLASAEDSSPVVRRSSLWALWKLSEKYAAESRQRLTELLNTARNDQHSDVRGEASRLLLLME